MWPFGKPVEARASYTDAITNAILSAASSARATADGTAALEAASGLLSRGFASAEVAGADSLPITPEFLGRVGRELIWPGESVFLIDVDGGGSVRLFPVSAYEIQGGYDPGSWVYAIELVGPSRSARLFVRRRRSCTFAIRPIHVGRGAASGRSDVRGYRRGS